MNALTPDDLVRRLAARYTQGAAGYADHWSAVVRPIGERLLDHLPLAAAGSVLDVGTGTGPLIPRLRALAPEAAIVGIDHAAGMLRRASAPPGALLCLMDARALATPAAAFDVAVLSFVLFHFPDIPAGLKEVRRVLKPGGCIGCATFASRPSFPAAEIWDEALGALDRPAGAPTVDLSSVDQVSLTDSPEKVRALLHAAGFTLTRTWAEPHEHQWTPESFLAVRTGFGSSGARFNRLDAAAQADLLARVRARLDALSPADFVFRPEVVFATAHRPA
jgi:SAM-dependent methyltransferase